MNLYVLRHGIAEEMHGSKHARDSERELTARGVEKMRQIARGMEKLELSFDVIVSSPYARARQTAEIVVERHRRARFEISDTLTPSGSARKLIDLLNGMAGRKEQVLLVSHEPFSSELVSLLISGQISSAIQLKKGGLCKLGVENLRYARCAVLEWLLTPGQLRRLA